MHCEYTDTLQMRRKIAIRSFYKSSINDCARAMVLSQNYCRPHTPGSEQGRPRTFQKHTATRLFLPPDDAVARCSDSRPQLSLLQTAMQLFRPKKLESGHVTAVTNSKSLKAVAQSLRHAMDKPEMA